MAACISDLLIIGGGPAGLSAAINGASEGLAVRLLDNGSTLGGQAKESSGIENYPGFPEGITGTELMGRMAQQAVKFVTGITSPVLAQHIDRDPATNLIHVTCDDYSEYAAKSVLLSMGVSYRRLQADGIGPFVGKGVFYGMPTVQPKEDVKTVAVIGGANSAGQAALGLATSGRLNVKLLSRKPLEAAMSTYLIERIRANPNIEVIEMCEVTLCKGDTCLRHITAKQGDSSIAFDVECMYIFIGATPRTLWLRNSLTLDDHNYIKTGGSLYYETSMPGVFAAGDVRSGSTKRIATAVGEGAGALQMIHSYLARL